MQITLFAERQQTKEGRTFYRYLTTLKRVNKETGETEDVMMEVKFHEACGKPDGANCPMYINIDKRMCNFNSKMEKYTVAIQDDDGNDTGEREERESLKNVLWVKAWEEGPEYVDHSMDDFIE